MTQSQASALPPLDVPRTDAGLASTSTDTYSDCSLSYSPNINNGIAIMTDEPNDFHSLPQHARNPRQDNASNNTTSNTSLSSADWQQPELPLSDYVEHAVRQYFTALDGATSSNLYELILQEVERPLLTVVLEYTRGNQSKCAKILGLNRGTLRTKLKSYQLIK